MNRQINLRLPEKLRKSAEAETKRRGYGTVQEFIKELLRDELFEPEITKEEIALVKEIKRVSDKYNLYAGEDEFKKALRENRKCDTK